MARQAISKFYQRDEQEEGRQDCRFEALPSHGRNRSVGSEGSQPAGVLDSVSELGRIGSSCGQVESVLRQRLALAFYDGNRPHAPGSHNLRMMWKDSVSAARHRTPTVPFERCVGCFTKRKNGI